MFVQGKEYDKIDDLEKEIVSRIVQKYVLGAEKEMLEAEGKERKLWAAAIAIWVFGASIGLNMFLLLWR